MGVVRLGYIHVRVTDIEEAKKHYCQTVGFRLVKDEGKRVFLKGWDEWEHHSVVLEEGGIGVIKLGYKVAKADDLEVIEAKAKTFGVAMERMSAGDNLETADGLRITLPSTHTIELYHNMTVTGSDVGRINPDVFPRDLVGIGAPRIDHALLGCDNVNETEKFLIDVFDFYQVERLVPDLEHQDVSLATWLSSGNRGHDLALIQGEGYSGKLHHFAFQLQEWSDILHAGQIMSMDDVPIEMGPTQHGITRGKTIYYYDPSGNRNEVFADGYTAQRDRPTIIWTADHLAKGINYVNRTLAEAFTTVLT
ncbi:MAG: catechol 2,3-dioxygenase [Propionibacteriaceae bacterium]|jgi:catechol 2,3-dioxygenase|nr:catechol 2,3-dioxygenase [Propionibacteriaceae bacterium]